MTQFYAQGQDQEKCLRSSMNQTPTTLTGLTMDGEVRAFTGTVQSVEIGHTAYPGYPLRITMPDAKMR
jgi:hypothetical protein